MLPLCRRIAEELAFRFGALLLGISGDPGNAKDTLIYAFGQGLAGATALFPPLPEAPEAGPRLLRGHKSLVRPPKKAKKGHK